MRATEFTNIKPHLYLDMDGVQADFFSAWARLFGKERYKDIGDRPAREASIDDLNRRGPEFIEQFFATLPPLPGGQQLIAWLHKNNVPFTVLSAPLRGNEEASIRGKKTWLDRYNPGTSSTAIFSSEKQKLALTQGHPNVLVDDFKKYVNAWTSAGGIGLLYRDNNVDHVIAKLEEIYNTDTPIAESQNTDFFQSHALRMKTYLVKLNLKNGKIKQYMDTTVMARNPEMARRIIKNIYGANVMVGQPRELK